MPRSRPFLPTSAQALRLRLSRGRPRPLAVAVLLSAFVHALGAVGLSRLQFAEPEPVRVLQVAFVSRGAEPGDKEAGPPEPPEPTQAKDARAAPAPAPASPSPRVAEPVTRAADLPEIRFPALARAARGPVRPVDVEAPTTFEAWQQSRTSPLIPNRIPDGGGSPDGVASVDSEGRDKCVPFPGRELDRLYLLFDSSGSMSSQLRAQALSCAQQYAEAAIESGADVVVGNFARSSTFHPPTRNLTDVAFALRGDSDNRATVLPSRELNPFFDQDPGARSDLVILSDGFIPNHREVLPWYRYYLEINPGNRGYLYTLGTPGHPEVTAALRKIGFEIYIYKIL